MIYYIYKITEKSTGRYYIGKRCCPYKFIENDPYFGSGKWISERVSMNNRHSFKKEIIEICDSKEDATYYEQYYAIKYGIPTVVFNARGRNIVLSQEKINKMFGTNIEVNFRQEFDIFNPDGTTTLDETPKLVEPPQQNGGE